MLLEERHVVADPAHAELPEVREVLPDLGGVEMELLGELARGHGLDSGLLQGVQAAQVDRQAVGRQARDMGGLHG